MWFVPHLPTRIWPLILYHISLFPPNTAALQYFMPIFSHFYSPFSPPFVPAESPKLIGAFGVKPNKPNSKSTVWAGITNSTRMPWQCVWLCHWIFSMPYFIQFILRQQCSFAPINPCWQLSNLFTIFFWLIWYFNVWSVDMGVGGNGKIPKNANITKYLNQIPVLNHTNHIQIHPIQRNGPLRHKMSILQNVYDHKSHKMSIRPKCYKMSMRPKC